MKRYLVILEKNRSTPVQLAADCEFHETDCPNLARKLLRANRHNGVIIPSQYLGKTLEEMIEFRHKYGQTTQHTVHIKRAGRNRG